MKKDSEWARLLQEDYKCVDLDPADRAMLDYSVKLSLEPWAVCEQDVARLKENRFSDRAILDINLVTGYYAFVNRLVDGLGVPLESFWKEDVEQRIPER